MDCLRVFYKFWEFFTYFIYIRTLTDMWCANIFSPFYSLTFILPKVYVEHMFLITMRSTSLIFVLEIMLVISKNLPKPWVQKMFSSTSFELLHCILKSIIHFELFFCICVRLSNSYLFPIILSSFAVVYPSSIEILLHLRQNQLWVSVLVSVWAPYYPVVCAFIPPPLPKGPA